MAKQLDGFTFTIKPASDSLDIDAPRQAMIAIQAIDTDGKPLVCCMPIDVWLTSSDDGRGTANQYREPARTQPAGFRPFTLLRGCLFATPHERCLWKIQTAADGSAAVSIAMQSGPVRVAAQAGVMLQPSVSRLLVNTDFSRPENATKMRDAKRPAGLSPMPTHQPPPRTKLAGVA